MPKNKNRIREKILQKYHGQIMAALAKKKHTHKIGSYYKKIKNADNRDGVIAALIEIDIKATPLEAGEILAENLLRKFYEEIQNNKEIENNKKEKILAFLEENWEHMNSHFSTMTKIGEKIKIFTEKINKSQLTEAYSEILPAINDQVRKKILDHVIKSLLDEAGNINEESKLALEKLLNENGDFLNKITEYYLAKAAANKENPTEDYSTLDPSIIGELQKTVKSRIESSLKNLSSSSEDIIQERRMLLSSFSILSDENSGPLAKPLDAETKDHLKKLFHSPSAPDKSGETKEATASFKPLSQPEGPEAPKIIDTTSPPPPTDTKSEEKPLADEKEKAPSKQELKKAVENLVETLKKKYLDENVAFNATKEIEEFIKKISEKSIIIEVTQYLSGSALPYPDRIPITVAVFEDKMRNAFDKANRLAIQPDIKSKIDALKRVPPKLKPQRSEKYIIAMQDYFDKVMKEKMEIFAQYYFPSKSTEIDLLPKYELKELSQLLFEEFLQSIESKFSDQKPTKRQLDFIAGKMKEIDSNKLSVNISRPSRLSLTKDISDSESKEIFTAITSLDANLNETLKEPTNNIMQKYLAAYAVKKAEENSDRDTLKEDYINAGKIFLENKAIQNLEPHQKIALLRLITPTESSFTLSDLLPTVEKTVFNDVAKALQIYLKVLNIDNFELNEIVKKADEKAAAEKAEADATAAKEKEASTEAQLEALKEAAEAAREAAEIARAEAEQADEGIKAVRKAIGENIPSEIEEKLQKDIIDAEQKKTNAEEKEIVAKAAESNAEQAKSKLKEEKSTKKQKISDMYSTFLSKLTAISKSFISMNLTTDQKANFNERLKKIIALSYSEIDKNTQLTSADILLIEEHLKGNDSYKPMNKLSTNQSNQLLGNINAIIKEYYDELENIKREAQVISDTEEEKIAKKAKEEKEQQDLENKKIEKAKEEIRNACKELLSAAKSRINSLDSLKNTLTQQHLMGVIIDLHLDSILTIKNLTSQDVLIIAQYIRANTSYNPTLTTQPDIDPKTLTEINRLIVSMYTKLKKLEEEAQNIISKDEKISAAGPAADAKAAETKKDFSPPTPSPAAVAETKATAEKAAASPATYTAATATHAAEAKAAASPSEAASLPLQPETKKDERRDKIHEIARNHALNHLMHKMENIFNGEQNLKAVEIEANKLADELAGKIMGIKLDPDQYQKLIIFLGSNEIFTGEPFKLNFVILNSNNLKELENVFEDFYIKIDSIRQQSTLKAELISLLAEKGGEIFDTFPDTSVDITKAISEIYFFILSLDYTLAKEVMAKISEHGLVNFFAKVDFNNFSKNKNLIKNAFTKFNNTLISLSAKQKSAVDAKAAETKAAAAATTSPAKTETKATAAAAATAAPTVAASTAAASAIPAAEVKAVADTAAATTSSAAATTLPAAEAKKFTGAEKDIPDIIKGNKVLLIQIGAFLRGQGYNKKFESAGYPEEVTKIINDLAILQKFFDDKGKSNEELNQLIKMANELKRQIVDKERIKNSGVRSYKRGELILPTFTKEKPTIIEIKPGQNVWQAYAANKGNAGEEKAAIPLVSLSSHASDPGLDDWVENIGASHMLLSKIQLDTTDPTSETHIVSYIDNKANADIVTSVVQLDPTLLTDNIYLSAMPHSDILRDRGGMSVICGVLADYMRNHQPRKHPDDKNAIKEFFKSPSGKNLLTSKGVTMSAGDLADLLSNGYKAATIRNSEKLLSLAILTVEEFITKNLYSSDNTLHITSAWSPEIVKQIMIYCELRNHRADSSQKIDYYNESRYDIPKITTEDTNSMYSKIMGISDKLGHPLNHLVSKLPYKLSTASSLDSKYAAEANAKSHIKYARILPQSENLSAYKKFLEDKMKKHFPRENPSADSKIPPSPGDSDADSKSPTSSRKR